MAADNARFERTQPHDRPSAEDSELRSHALGGADVSREDIVALNRRQAETPTPGVSPDRTTLEIPPLQADERGARWLLNRIDRAAVIPLGDTMTELREPAIELSIRLRIRGMDQQQRESLDRELRRPENGGLTLAQNLDRSGLSAETRWMLSEYLRRGPNLTSGDLREMVDHVLRAPIGSQERLTMFSELFVGPSSAAQQARREFMDPQGTGERRLRQAFSGNELQQALDYVRDGEMHPSTWIRGEVGLRTIGNDGGVQTVLGAMTQRDRLVFAEGQRLSRGSETPTNDEQRSALEYYQRTHSALMDATFNYASPMRWWPNHVRELQVQQWEDLAVHGRRTLFGRLANLAQQDGLNPREVQQVIRDATPEDRALMQNPLYRESVQSLLRHPNLGTESTARGSEELRRQFGDGAPASGGMQTHPALADAARARWTGSSGRFVADIYEALIHGSASEFRQLGESERRALATRVESFDRSPAGESARRMLSELQAGRDVSAGLAERLFLQQLRGDASPMNVIRTFMTAPPAERANPDAAGAVRAILSDRQTQRLTSDVLNGQGLTLPNLRALNLHSNLFAQVLDFRSYYGNLDLVDVRERERILAAAANPTRENLRRLEVAFPRDISRPERDIALAVLGNPNQEFTLRDRIRCYAVTREGDVPNLLEQLNRLSEPERLHLINDYARVYRQSLVADMSRNANPSERRQIELAMPMSPDEAQRGLFDWATDTSSGWYGHTANVEIMLRSVQQTVQVNLLDQLPENQREQARRDISLSFQRYVLALAQNDQARGQWARNLADTIIGTVGTVAPPNLASVTRVLFAAAGAVALRAGIETAAGGPTALRLMEYAGLAANDVVGAAVPTRDAALPVLRAAAAPVRTVATDVTSRSAAAVTRISENFRPRQAEEATVFAAPRSQHRAVANPPAVPAAPASPPPVPTPALLRNFESRYGVTVTNNASDWLSNNVLDQLRLMFAENGATRQSFSGVNLLLSRNRPLEDFPNISPLNRNASAMFHPARNLISFHQPTFEVQVPFLLEANRELSARYVMNHEGGHVVDRNVRRFFPGGGQGYMSEFEGFRAAWVADVNRMTPSQRQAQSYFATRLYNGHQPQMEMFAETIAHLRTFQFRRLPVENRDVWPINLFRSTAAQLIRTGVVRPNEISPALVPNLHPVVQEAIERVRRR